MSPFLLLVMSVGVPGSLSLCLFLQLDEGTWPQNGAQEVQVNLERTAALSLRLWLSGWERDAVELPLPEDVPFFAVTPHAPLGQINTATAAMAASQKAKRESPLRSTMVLAPITSLMTTLACSVLQCTRTPR